MPTLKCQNAEIFYSVTGETGPWITLVNGHTRTHKDFKMLTKVLVADGFRCLSLDNRGAGESTSAEFNFEDWVSDIKSIWDELGVPFSHLLGISMGGMISQALASQHPHRVNKLILVSTSAQDKWIQDISSRSWGESIEDVQAKLQLYFARSFAERNKLLVDSMAKQIWKGISSGEFSQGSQRQRQAMRGINLLNQLEGIRSPTLVIHGQEDQVIDPKASAELSERIPDTQLEYIEGAGHLLLAEASKTLSQLVVSFIQ